MIQVPEQFDSIRPFEDHELQGVLDSLFEDRTFRRNVKSLIGPCPLWLLRLYLRRFRNIDSFQKGIVVPWLKRLLKKKSLGLDFDLGEIGHDCQDRLFISNHRDIILDSAILDVILLENGCHSANIAIGNNLFAFPWIESMVRLNRSFTVNRNAAAQELLESSKLLSQYISYVIKDRKMPVWIAQREGRAKDSNDRTQRSVLKMLSMAAGSGCADVRRALASLHICPLSISYEYDPCDWLKAREFQLKRDSPDYRKTKKDDVENMKTGLYGFKGHIHYHASDPIDEEIMAIDRSLPRNAILDQVAAIIDRHIFKNYAIYPCNRVALDMLRRDNSQQGLYSEQDRKAFEAYLEGQLAKIDLPDPDMEFLRQSILTMYANPLINHIQSL